MCIRHSKFIDKIKLWNVVPRPNDGSKVIDTRWVDVNKGDENEPLVRARLVAKGNQEERDVGSILLLQCHLCSHLSCYLA